MNQIAIVTRSEVTQFVKPLLVIFLIALLMLILGTILFNMSFKKKRHKKEKTKGLSTVYLVTLVLSETVIFLAGPTLFIMLILLATMNTEVLVNEYIVLIGLVYFFSAFLGITFLRITGRRFFKKQHRIKRKSKRVSFTWYLLSAMSIHLVSYMAVYFLYPANFILLVLFYNLFSLLINGIGLLLETLSYQKSVKMKETKSKNKKKKSKRKVS